MIRFTCCAVSETWRRPVDEYGWRLGESTCMTVGANAPTRFFWPAYTGPGYSALPLLEGVGWLSAWVLWTELKSTRMPMIPGEHAQDVDEVVAVSRKSDLASKQKTKATTARVCVRRKPQLLLACLPLWLAWVVGG